MTPGREATVTVVIPTKDAADLLRGCLESVAWADEIIVVDMFSTDDTAEVCAAYPQCRLHQREDYIFGNVNFGFDQASSDWVMRLDTDERITPELAQEIRGLMASATSDVTGYAFWERPVILGRELHHGFGRRHSRKMLFRRGAARYPVRSEHEDLETSGTWLQTQNGYLHHNYRSVRQYLEKTNYYTDRDIERMELPAKAPSARHGATSVARAFYLYYLKMRGYRDGWVGFVDASMRAFYQLVLWAKVRERFESERSPDGD